MFDNKFHMVMYELDSYIRNIIYDGNSHGINLNITSPSNAKVMYADDDGKYILDDMPKYKDIKKRKFQIYKFLLAKFI